MRSLGLLKAPATTKVEVGIVSKPSAMGFSETSRCDAWVPRQTEFKTHNALEKVQGDEIPGSNVLGKLTNGSKEIQRRKR